MSEWYWRMMNFGDPIPVVFHEGKMVCWPQTPEQAAFITEACNAYEKVKEDEPLPWLKSHAQNAKCASEECGHAYYRHFDTYEDMRAIGCKYCQCWTFVES